MTLLAESNAGLCRGTGTQFSHESWSGTFDGALCWILGGIGCQILGGTSNGVGGCTVCLTGCWTGGQTDDGTSSRNDNGIHCQTHNWPFTLTAFGGGSGTAGGIGSKTSGLVCGETGDGTPHQERVATSSKARLPPGHSSNHAYGPVGRVQGWVLQWNWLLVWQ